MGQLASPVHIPACVLGVSKVIGGAAVDDSDIIARCFARMQCWVSMATTVLEAEFPSWNVAATCNVFALGTKGGGAAAAW